METETFIAYANGSYYRHRLHAARSDRLLPKAPYALTSQAGQLHLIPVPNETTPLADNEIELVVYASGLNFRDVLNHLGLYPGDAGPLGGEAAGVIRRIGKAVTRFKVGDSVFGEVLGGFCTYTRTYEDLLAHLPSHLTYTQAAGLPVVFLTAYYALITCAHLKSGDKVLIHAATGGVGLAAIQLARHCGAIVYATASQPKQAYLRSLGIEHIYDSRRTDFGQQILADTHRCWC